MTMPRIAARRLVDRCPALLLGAALACGAARAAAPVPHVSHDGPALNFDFPGLEVGVAEYEEGPTGLTVLNFPGMVLAAIDVRGGAPGTINSDLVHMPHDDARVNSIVLTGGSAYGLTAAGGVSNALKDRLDDPGDFRKVAVVAGAVIFDLGGRRYNAIAPDEALGRAALKAARPGWVPLGARGAGRFAMQGGYFDPQHSGQGAAFRQSGPTKVLVVTIVNAVGSIVDRNGRLLRCSHPGPGGECPAINERIAQHLAQSAMPKSARLEPIATGPTANTTITCVITNEKMPFSMLQRLAIQVHNAMSRAIQPFGTLADGDTLFAVTTGEVSNPALNPIELGILASETAWDAVLASAPAPSVRTARSGAAPPAAKAQEALVGRYQLAPGVNAEVRHAAQGLEVVADKRDTMYLQAGKAVGLSWVAGDEYELASPRADRLRFDRDARGRVTGFTLEPGAWPVKAERLP